jgi:hypothetical protein
MAWGLEPLHALLPLAGRWVGVLGAIIEIPIWAMLHTRKNLALSCFGALEFVSHAHARHVRQALEQLAEELLGRPLIPAALHQAIQHAPLLIHRPPQIVMLALDCEKYLIHLPLVTRPRTAATELVGILLTKLPTPLPNRFIRHDHAAFKEELFHIAEAQAEAKVESYGVADDLHGKPVMLIFRGSGRCVHAVTLPHHVAPQQFDNACPRYSHTSARNKADREKDWCVRDDGLVLALPLRGAVGLVFRPSEHFVHSFVTPRAETHERAPRHRRGTTPVCQRAGRGATDATDHPCVCWTR